MIGWDVKFDEWVYPVRVLAGAETPLDDVVKDARVALAKAYRDDAATAEIVSVTRAPEIHAIHVDAL